MSYVYFAERRGRIKIGFSKCPIGRVRPLKAKLIGCIPGTRELERELHDKFADSRRDGEWFEDCETIRSFLSSREDLLASAGDVPIYTTIPEYLYDFVAAEAKRQNRSIASQIMMILVSKYDPRRINT